MLCLTDIAVTSSRKTMIEERLQLYFPIEEERQEAFEPLLARALQRQLEQGRRDRKPRGSTSRRMAQQGMR